MGEVMGMRSLHEIAKVAVKIHYNKSAFVPSDVSFQAAQKKAAAANPTLKKEIYRLTVEELFNVRKDDERRVQENTEAIGAF